MDAIKDYNCMFDDSVGINKAVSEELDLDFPEAYTHWETMADIAKAMKRHDRADFCQLPFCHTVEAEAMGGQVNLGNDRTGPRAGEYLCTDIEEILVLPDIEYSTGRIQEVLHACRHLREQGEDVILQVSGPFTILSVLLDARYIFKGMRKKPEIMKKVYEKLEKELLRYIEEAQKCGVSFISYADAPGGVNILGSKTAAQVVDAFTYRFLKKTKDLVDGNTVILLCPKTTYSLLGTQKAKFVDVELEKAETYGRACKALAGRETFVGQMCIKSRNHILKNKKIKAVRLL